MRRIALSVAVSLLALVGVARSAQAETTTAAQCNSMLVDADDARVSLESMEVTLADLNAEAASLERRVLELQTDIRFAKLGGNDKAAKKLKAELAGVEKDLQFVETLRPDIAGQVAELREIVSKTDHAYIACIVQTISG
jgi:chromosome segregation ATPase